MRVSTTCSHPDARTSSRTARALPTRRRAARGACGRRHAVGFILRSRFLDEVLHFLVDDGDRRRRLFSSDTQAAGADAATATWRQPSAFSSRAIARGAARPVARFRRRAACGRCGSANRTRARRPLGVCCHSASSQPARSRRCRATSSEPGLTLKTPCDSCSTRRAIPKPCIGSRLSVLRMSMSSVPWMTSVFGFSTVPQRYRRLHLDCQDVSVKCGLRSRSDAAAHGTHAGEARRRDSGDRRLPLRAEMGRLPRDRLSRHGRPVHPEPRSETARPLFSRAARALLERLPAGCVVDGEIVIATDDGLDFDALQLRLHPAASRVAKLAAAKPVVVRRLRSPGGRRRSILALAAAANGARRSNGCSQSRSRRST